MAPEPGLALSLGIIFAMAMIVLAITTRIMRALPPIPPREMIDRRFSQEPAILRLVSSAPL
jgi:multisubunit Na+/H+ antiporter MnhB subunit